MGSPRLRSLHIHKYRHVVPGTSLEFGAGFNVLLGRNGTGKTTLLELIEMIWSKGFEQIANEAFHLEYTVEFDDLDVPADPTLAAFDPTLTRDRTVSGCIIHVMVENLASELPRSGGRQARAPSSQLQFRYRVDVKSRAGANMLTIEGTPMSASLQLSTAAAPVPVAVLTATSWPLVWSAPRQYFDSGISADADASNESPVLEWAEWCSFIIDDIKNTGRFDESLGAYQALTSREYHRPESGLEGVRWEIERRIDSQAKVYPYQSRDSAFFPRGLLHHWGEILREDPRLDPPEFQTSIRETSLAVFLELTDYSDILIRSGAPSRDRREDGVVELLKFGPPEFRILLANNRGEISAQALSYGEKRLLSFLWHLACDPSVIIADELVNGFHHAWIERCVELIGQRQAFLASQNPLLLDCLPLDSEADVRGCFITCRRNDDGQMSWTNLTAEEAADFYRSYERQTRYTHEILRSKGLW